MYVPFKSLAVICKSPTSLAGLTKKNGPSGSYLTVSK